MPCVFLLRHSHPYHGRGIRFLRDDPYRVRIQLQFNSFLIFDDDEVYVDVANLVY